MAKQRHKTQVEKDLSLMIELNDRRNELAELEAAVEHMKKQIEDEVGKGFIDEQVERMRAKVEDLQEAISDCASTEMSCLNDRRPEYFPRYR